MEKYSGISLNFLSFLFHPVIYPVAVCAQRYALFYLFPHLFIFARTKQLMDLGISLSFTMMKIYSSGMRRSHKKTGQTCFVLSVFFTLSLSSQLCSGNNSLTVPLIPSGPVSFAMLLSLVLIFIRQVAVPMCWLHKGKIAYFKGAL